MSTEERRLGAAVALIATGVALTLAAFAAWASGDCAVFGLDDLFRCRTSGPFAALLDATAAASAVALVLCLPTRVWPAPRRYITELALAGAAIAALGAIALPFVPSDPTYRITALGWALVGVWLFDLSRRGPADIRSNTGILVGVTLVVWALLAAFVDYPLPVIGGALFFALFDVWAFRGARRLLRGHTPALDAHGIRGWVTEALVAIGVVFVGLPLWMVSTIGVPLGDPSVSYTLRNETSAPIAFYIQDYEIGHFPGDQVAAGAEYKSNALATSTYHTVATDASGARIFCQTLSQRELRQARFVVVIRNEPETCR